MLISSCLTGPMPFTGEEQVKAGIMSRAMSLWGPQIYHQEINCDNERVVVIGWSLLTIQSFQQGCKI